MYSICMLYVQGQPKQFICTSGREFCNEMFMQGFLSLVRVDIIPNSVYMYMYVIVCGSDRMDTPCR